MADMPAPANPPTDEELQAMENMDLMEPPPLPPAPSRAPSMEDKEGDLSEETSTVPGRHFYISPCESLVCSFSRGQKCVESVSSFENILISSFLHLPLVLRR